MCVCVGGGLGVGDRLESPDETNSIFVRFFARIVVFIRLGGGGVNC